jgi:hypothetical protein
MRTLLFCLLIVLGQIPVYCQEPIVEEPEFKVTRVPENWAQESAVILAQKIDYAYVRKAMANAMTIREYVRKRIKLQDKNALEKFSEFYYVTYGKKTAIAYSIIKQNGKVVPVDMSKAIEVDQRVDNVFRPIYLTNTTSYYKIAIPDLEIGDIIDYHYASAIDVMLERVSGEFTPYIFTLTYNYPVLYQKFQFELDKGTHALFKSYNGAPKLNEGDEGFDTKASDKRSLVSYFIVDKNREKSTDERWNYTYRNAPTVKLKIMYTPGGLGNTLFGRKGEATEESVSLQKLQTMYTPLQYYTTPVVEGMARDILDYLKYNKKENLPADTLVREMYYVFRKIFLASYYSGEVKAQYAGAFGAKRRVVQKQTKKQIAEKEDVVTINKLLWAAVLTRVCDKVGLQVEVLVIMPRYLGQWSDMLFEEELELAMRIHGSTYYYMFPFDNFDAFAHPSESFDDSGAYAFGLNGGRRYSKANIPATTFNQNITKQESVVTIPESMDLLKVERTSTFTGLEKNDAIALAHLDRDYLVKDLKKFVINPKKDKADTTYNDPDKEERKKTQLEYLQKGVERDELEVEKYEQFTLLQDGRYDQTPVLSYKENYSLKKLVNKAGRNYLLDVGKLIGTQIKLEEKELKKRDNDIWIPYARTIANNVTIVLPNGYTAEGWQDMNMQIDNESGAFVATAKLDGSKLLIATKKIYKKNFDKKELWSNYVAFLEAAYKFTQTKIVLKKQS